MIINDDAEFTYYLTVLAFQGDNGGWCLEIEHFQGDHWHSDQANEVWKAVAAHMADGASIEFQGQEGERWRVRFHDGRVFEDYVITAVWSDGDQLL